MENLRQKVFSSAGWMSLLRYLSTGINIVGGIYLARMIDPEIFGRVGLMVAVIGIITMTSMWGFFGQAEEPKAFWGPRDVAVDSLGRVFVTDTGNAVNRTVRVVDVTFFVTILQKNLPVVIQLFQTGLIDIEVSVMVSDRDVDNIVAIKLAQKVITVTDHFEVVVSGNKVQVLVTL